MIALLQRVQKASVEVQKETIASVNYGMLVFLAVQKNDNKASAQRMCEKLLTYRIFSDHEQKMNKNIQDIQGGILLVPQFTLAADTHRGLRPSFSNAAAPAKGEILFDHLLNKLSENYAKVKAGMFGADMQVQLINDGPVTFWLEVKAE